MNKYIKANLLATCLLLGLNAFAGDIAGNGGDIVTCTNSAGKIESSKLLDYYELEELQGKRLDLGRGGLTYTEKVNYALDKLSVLSPHRANDYRKELEVFFDRTLFINGPIPEVDDEGELGLPENCKLEQAAIQLSGEGEPFHKYLIRQAAWDVMDNDSKAGLILHEIIFDEISNSLAGQGRGSISVRRLNRMISSIEIESKSQNEMAEFYTRERFETMSYNGMNLFVYRPKKNVPRSSKMVTQSTEFYSGDRFEYVSLYKALIRLEGGKSITLQTVNSDQITFYCPEKICRIEATYNRDGEIYELELDLEFEPQSFDRHEDYAVPVTSGKISAQGVDTKLVNNFQYLRYPYVFKGVRGDSFKPFKVRLIKPGALRVFNKDNQLLCIMPNHENPGEDGMYVGTSHYNTELHLNKKWQLTNEEFQIGEEFGRPYREVPMSECD